MTSDQGHTSWGQVLTGQKYPVPLHRESTLGMEMPTKGTPLLMTFSATSFREHTLHAELPELELQHTQQTGSAPGPRCAGLSGLADTCSGPGQRQTGERSVGSNRPPHPLTILALLSTRNLSISTLSLNMHIYLGGEPTRLCLCLREGIRCCHLCCHKRFLNAHMSGTAFLHVWKDGGSM